MSVAARTPALQSGAIRLACVETHRHFNGVEASTTRPCDYGVTSGYRAARNLADFASFGRSAVSFKNGDFGRSANFPQSRVRPANESALDATPINRRFLAASFLRTVSEVCSELADLPKANKAAAGQICLVLIPTRYPAPRRSRAIAGIADVSWHAAGD
jgi:hypothetical protein